MAQASYKIKTIEFGPSCRKVQIVVQNENGPCPLLAIANCLLLRNAIQLPANAPDVTQERLISLVAGHLLDANSEERLAATSPEYTANVRQSISDVIALLPKLATGVDVNVRFHNVHAFEYTDDVAIFPLLDIDLVHGWLVDPQDAAAGALAGRSYNEVLTQLVTVLGDEPAAFLERSGNQLTEHGLVQLHDAMRPQQLAVFFRNNHFNVLFKHCGSGSSDGALMTLVTDQGYLHEQDVVWERLDSVHNDTTFLRSDLAPFQAPPNRDLADRAAMAASLAQAAFASIVPQRQGKTVEGVGGSGPATDGDADLALALQLQEEENERAEQAARQERKEGELRQQQAAPAGQRQGQDPNYVPCVTHPGKDCVQGSKVVALAPFDAVDACPTVAIEGTSLTEKSIEDQISTCINAVRQKPDTFACQYPCRYADWRGDVVSPVRGPMAFAGTPGTDELNSAAQAHSADQARNNFFSHDGSDNSTLADRAAGAGFLTFPLGENIAAGFNSVRSLVLAWMCSEGHRTNLMGCGFDTMGTGMGFNPASYYKSYFTQDFGCSRDDFNCQCPQIVDPATAAPPANGASALLVAALGGAPDLALGAAGVAIAFEGGASGGGVADVQPFPGLPGVFLIEVDHPDKYTGSVTVSLPDAGDVAPLRYQVVTRALAVQSLGTFRRGVVQAPSEGVSSEAEEAESDDWSLYDYPALYHRVFGYRDFKTEADFLRKVHVQLCGRKAKAFLEVGCGPGQHSIALAERGTMVYALDNHTEMLSYARELAAAAGARITFLEADMEDFSLPGGAQADVAFLPLGTLAHALSNEAAMATLRACRQALRPGGLLILELTHPEDIFNGQLLAGDTWDIEAEEDAPALMVEFGSEETDEIDAETQVVRRRLVVSEVEAAEGGEEGDAQVEVLGEGIVLQRVFTLQEIRLLSEAAGLTLAATYGELDTSIALADEEAYRLVACLQRPSVDTLGPQT
ncbi:hypothetical protein WJX81_005721 [Elliptochloris bilobata]|uniref:MINDY deubiquitinase domain-containing protein n=1 Tax=Elliptochloris bilobata TaxID=381761 RepID=A0AAW1QHQ4_9CHLO